MLDQGIAFEDIQPFVFDFDKREALVDESIGGSSLERSPIIIQGDDLYVLLPTAISVAVRRFFLERMHGPKLNEAFLLLLAEEHARLFEALPFLGGGAGIGLEFRRTEASLVGGVMREVDDGIYLNVIFCVDLLEDYETTGLSGMADGPPGLVSDLEAWIDRAHSHASQKPGFREGLSLIVGCGIGRGLSLKVPKVEMSDWRLEFISAPDFYTLGWLPEFKPLSLFRLRDAEDELAKSGVHLFNLNGLLNQVAWMQSLRGHLVPHAQLPESFGEGEGHNCIIVEQNALRRVRHEVAQRFDPHVTKDIDGRWISVRKIDDSIFEEDARRPFFATEQRIGRWPMGVYEAAKRTWWCELQTTADTQDHAAYERSKMVFTWLSRAAPVLDTELPALPLGALLWRVHFSTQLRTTAEKPERRILSYDEALASISIEVIEPARTVALTVGTDFEDALFHQENIAERALVARMIEGFSLLADVRLSAEESEALVGKIVPDVFARQAHVFWGRSFRDHFNGRAARTLSIDQDNDALIKLGLGWRVRDRTQGGEISGKQACTEYLNAVVRLLENDVCQSLRAFNLEAVLSIALMQHEASAIERDLWRRTTPAILGLHDDKDACRQKLANHDYRLNAVLQGTRLIVELAVCECPEIGGREPGELEFSRLMSKLLLLSGLGGWSDAIHYDAMEARIRVAPLGDILANVSFEEDVLAAYGRAGNDVRIEDSIEWYAENYQELKTVATDGSAWPDDFWRAFEEEFGATFGEVRTFVDYVEDLGLQADSLLVKVKRSKLCDIHLGDKSIPAATASVLVDNLTFPRRQGWHTLPPGYSEKDRFPWRYRRKLSLLRKPLITLDDGDDPTIIVAPGFLREAFAYMLAGFYRGDFPLHQLKPRMRAWAGRSKNETGHAFNQLVANRMRELGWKAEVELKPTRLLQIKLDRDYGDVDVVAWDETRGRILLMECKDLQHRKAIGEIAEQLADYRGIVRPNGKPDELLRHLNRVDILRNDADSVLRALKFRGTAKIESHLVFKNSVPMQFALRNLKERVAVHVYSHLHRI